MMVPSKLKRGDEIRIITPARSLSMSWISDDLKEIAQRKLESLGLVVSFGKHVNEIDEFDSSSIKSRVEDLHEAFKDKNVKAILTVIGGYNSVEIVKHLDYEIITNNPKILCGYSDITTLQNAILSKTGLIVYSGPHFFDFGEIKNFDYTLDYFRKCLFQDKPFNVNPADVWSYDKWGKDQDNRSFEKNKGYIWIQKGTIEGEVVGGNLSSLHLLQGTEYFPNLKDKVLFIEEDEEFNRDTLLRYLVSLTLPLKSSIKGIVFGRFRPESNISIESLKKIVSRIDFLKDIPIIANVDFGHTSPKITIPLGGKVFIKENKGKIEFLFEKF